MAQIIWQETWQRGRKTWRGGGPYFDIPGPWEIVCIPDLISGDPIFHVFAANDLGGHGYGEYALSMDCFPSLNDAKAFFQAMHDEAISGCDTGW